MLVSIAICLARFPYRNWRPIMSCRHATILSCPALRILINHITYDIKLLTEASNGCPLRDLRNFSRSSAWPVETEGIVTWCEGDGCVFCVRLSRGRCSVGCCLVVL